MQRRPSEDNLESASEVAYYLLLLLTNTVTFVGLRTADPAAAPEPAYPGFKHSLYSLRLKCCPRPDELPSATAIGVTRVQDPLADTLEICSTIVARSYIVMAHTVVAYIVMACIVMAT